MTNTTNSVGTITKAEWLVIRDAHKAAHARYMDATKAYRAIAREIAERTVAVESL